jgi:hypothetical protein
MVDNRRIEMNPKLFFIRSQNAFGYYVLATDLIEAIGEAERLHRLKGRGTFVMVETSLVSGAGSASDFGITSSAAATLNR